MNNLLIFTFGLALEIIITILVLLYLYRVKCSRCKKKKPLKEILVLANQDKWEIKGTNCNACEKAKKQTQIEIF